jgi:hypothetical protein
MLRLNQQGHLRKQSANSACKAGLFCRLLAAFAPIFRQKINEFNVSVTWHCPCIALGEERRQGAIG